MIALLCALAAAPVFERSVTGGATIRRIYFKDRLTPTLAGWKSGGLATLGFSLQAWPSTGKLPVIDDIGAYGWFERSFVSETLTADETLAFTTQETAWETGLRWRAILGGQERGGVSFGYGSLRHVFTGAQLPGYILPNGMVQYWRPGLDGRFNAGPAAINIGAAYLWVVRHDFLDAYFPRASKHGIEFTARASMTVWKLLLTLSGRYQHYFYSLNPQPYDPFIAGGALDEVYAFDLACGYRL